MSFTARNLDPGTSPSAPCAVKTKGGVEFQGVIPIIGDQATDEYDSGFQTVPTADAALTVARVYLMSIYVFNGTDAVQWVTIQNAASSVKICDQMALQPRTAYPLVLHGNEILGLRWQASGAGVTASIKGYQ